MKLHTLALCALLLTGCTRVSPEARHEIMRLRDENDQLAEHITHLEAQVQDGGQRARHAPSPGPVTVTPDAGLRADYDAATNLIEQARIYTRQLQAQVAHQQREIARYERELAEVEVEVATLNEKLTALAKAPAKTTAPRKLRTRGLQGPNKWGKPTPRWKKKRLSDALR